MAPKRGGKAPVPAKKKTMQVTNPLFEKRPKQFGIGGTAAAQEGPALVHQVAQGPAHPAPPPLHNQFTRTLHKNTPLSTVASSPSTAARTGLNMTMQFSCQRKTEEALDKFDGNTSFKSDMGLVTHRQQTKDTVACGQPVKSWPEEGAELAHIVKHWTFSCSRVKYQDIASWGSGCVDTSFTFLIVRFVIGP